VIIVILGLVATVVLNGLFSSFTVTTQHQIFVTIGLIIVGTAVALGNTRLLGVITAVSVGIELTILLGVSLILLVFHTHHSPTALFHTYGALHGAGAWSAFATAVVTICVILVGSETAGIYAEEVTDSHVVSGKAMVTACLAVALSVFFFMVAMTLSTPDLHQAVADPETWIVGTVQSGLGTWAAKLFFTGALIAVLATTLATIAGGSRILFGMAREGQLPGASVLGRLNGSGTPMYATLVFAVLSVIPLFEVSKSLVLADAVSGLVLSAYVLTLGALVVARAKGWHSETFSFGAWAWPVTGAAFAVAFVLCLDTAWPRASTNPNLGGVPVLWDVWIGLAVLSPILWFLSRSSRTAVAKLDTQSSNLTASSE
jgi:amino acid transporter